MKIHPTAKVHPSCVLEGDDIEIGAGSQVDALCYLRGPIIIGENTRIYPHCVIGTEGEHKTATPTGVIRIGDRSIIRELVVIQRGTGDRETSIGDDCYIMEHTHVAHDLVIANHVTCSPNSMLGGHARIGEGANIGMNSTLHQFTTIGAHAMVGMGAVVTRDVPPFALAAGNPAVFMRLNTHPMKRLNIPATEVLIRDGALSSENAIVKAALEQFTKDRRESRKLLPLIPRSEKE